MRRPFLTVERNHIAHGLHSGFNIASILNSLLHTQHVLSLWLFVYLVIIAWKWRCVPWCFSPKPRLQSFDKAVLFSKTSVCIYQYVQVDGGVKHQTLNAVYNSSRYCVEEPLMQNMSQLSASCIKMHMNASEIQSKSSTTAEEQLSSSRHCSNQQGWMMQLIGVWQVFEQPVQADRNNWNWPFLVHQMLLMRPGVQTHSDVVDFSWAVLKLCWMFSC